MEVFDAYKSLDELEIKNFSSIFYSRMVGLAMLLSLIVFAVFHDRHLKKLISISATESAPAYSYNSSYFSEYCYPGQFRSYDELVHTRMTLKTHKNLLFDMPVYSTHDYTKDVLFKVKSVVIIQHGNLRDANDYFCGAVNSIEYSNMRDKESVLVLAPQFLVSGDFCWTDVDAERTLIYDNDSTTWCGFPVWSTIGWKDGHMSLGPSPNNPVYSYSVFNHLIEHFADSYKYPNLNSIVLFGFSAGAQVLLRFSTLTNYRLGHNPHIRIHFVVSDPSSYMYFDRRRPIPTAKVVQYDVLNMTGKSDTEVTSGFRQTFAFDIPDKDWNRWQVDATGVPWISNWDFQCSRYNEFRFGVDNFDGYHRFYTSTMTSPIESMLSGFRNERVTFLSGLRDTTNCKMKFNPACYDNELATYCEAMLQGDNRLDRALKWKAYLDLLYGGSNTAHTFILVEGVNHDPQQMVFSQTGRCIIFGVCG